VANLRDSKIVKEFLAISLGAIPGTLLRYLISGQFSVSPGSYPIATFLINTSGSFFLGIVFAIYITSPARFVYLRLLVAVGFLGSFTTFSTFALESATLISGRHIGVGLAYISLSIIVSIMGTLVGLALTRTAFNR
jgi:CrcB protein